MPLKFGSIDLPALDMGPVNPNDYLNDVDPANIYRDPRVLNDIREYYRRKGTTFTDDAEMIDQFQSDRTWRNVNTISMGKELLEANSTDKEQATRLGRLQQIWEMAPNRSFTEALPDYAAAAVLDPINLIGGMGAAKAGVQAARAGAGLAKTAKAAAAAGAKTEAVLEAGVTGTQDTLRQQANVDLGLQDEVHQTQTVANMTLGALLGGAVGGAVGVAGSPIWRKRALQQMDKLRALGVPEDEVTRMSFQQSEAFVRRGLPFEPETPDAPTPEQVDPLTSAQRAYERAAADGLEQEQLDAARQLVETARTEQIRREAAGADPEAHQRQLDQVEQTRDAALARQDVDPNAQAAGSPGEPVVSGDADVDVANRTVPLDEVPGEAAPEPKVNEAAKKLAAELGVDVTKAEPNAQGRITAGSVREAAKTQQAEEVTERVTAPDVEALYTRIRAQITEAAPELTESEHFHTIVRAMVDAENPQLTPAVMARVEADQAARGGRLEMAVKLDDPEDQKIFDKLVVKYAIQNKLPQPQAEQKAVVELFARKAKMKADALDPPAKQAPPAGQGGATQRAADTLAQGPTTAGQRADGKPQSMFKRGKATEFSKDADGNFQVERTIIGLPRPRNTAMNREAAIAKATIGRQKNRVVAYMTQAPTKVRDSAQPIPKGQTVYFDPITQKDYASLKSALMARGEGPLPQRAPEQGVIREQPAPKEGETPRATPVEEAVTEFLRKGASPEAVEIFKQRLTEIGAQRMAASPDPSVRAKAALPHLQAPQGRVIAIRDKTLPASDPAAYRVLSQAQRTQGRGVAHLIGKSFSEQWADKWEVGHVPDGTKSFSKAAPEQFRSTDISEVKKAEEPSVRPLTTEEADSTFLDLKTLDEASAKLIDGAFAKAGVPSSSQAGRVSAKALSVVADSLDRAVWPKTKELYTEHVSQLRAVYEALNRMAPDGIQRPAQEIESSVKQLHQLFDGHPQRILDLGERYLRKLVKAGPAPIFDEPRGGWFYNPTDNKVEVSPSSAKGPSKAALAGTPDLVGLYHETAHWAYFNVLSHADRLEFWRAIDKFYRAGAPDAEDIFSKMPPNIDRTRQFKPQEYFAHQFSMWATRGRSEGAFDDPGFWGRIARFVQGVFQRFMREDVIDGDLEPIFSKLLPEDQAARARIVKPGPKSYQHKGSQFIVRAYWNISTLEKELRAAIDADSPDSIIETSKDLVRSMFQLTAHGQKDTTFEPIRRGGGIIRARAKRLADLLHLRYEVEKVEGTDEYRLVDKSDQLGELNNPEGVADKIREFFAQKSNDADRYEGLGETLNFTRALLEDKFHRLEGAELSIPDMPRGWVIRRYGSEEARTARLQERRTLRKARRLERARVANDAEKTASTRRADRPRTDKVSTQTQTPKPASLAELIEQYRGAKGTDRADQLASEIVKKMRVASLPEKAVSVRSAVFGARTPQLADMLRDGLDRADRGLVDEVSYEIARRGANRERAERGLPPVRAIVLKDEKLEMAVKQEIEDNAGVSIDDGIPASARASVREVLSYMTHRDSTIEDTMRTVAYRLLNLSGRAKRGTAEELNAITHGDIADLAGVDPSTDPRAVFSDYQAPEFKAWRSSLRKVAAVLEKPIETPDDAMREVGTLVWRSPMFKEARAFTEREHPEFLNTWREHAAERIGKSSIPRSLRGTVDQLNEATAYVLNGLTRRKDVANAYRRFFLYGDLFTAGRSSVLASFPHDATAFPAELAADAADELVRAMSPEALARVREFTGAEPRVYFRSGASWGSTVSETPHAATLQEPVPADTPLELLDDRDRARANISRIRRWLVGDRLNDRDRDRMQVALNSAIEELEAIEQQLKNDYRMQSLRAEPVFVKARNILDLTPASTYTKAGELYKKVSVRYPDIDLALEDRFTGQELLDAMIRAESIEARANEVPEHASRQGVEAFMWNEGVADAIRWLDEIDGSHEQISLLDSYPHSPIKPVRSPEWQAPVAPKEGVDMPILGSLVQEIMDRGDPRLEMAVSGPALDLLESSGASPEMTNTLASMIRRRTPGPREAGWMKNLWRTTLGENSARIRHAGLHWPADFMQDFYHRHTSDLAGKFYGVKRLLEKLPDNPGSLNRWLKNSNPIGSPEQPRSYARIVSALRRGPDSRAWKALTKEELVAAKKIRDGLDAEYQAMRKSGVMVGHIPNYFPQLWNVSKIAAEPKKFVDKLGRYFQAEAKSLGHTMEEADSRARAQNVVARLTEEDGFYIPPPIGSQRQATSDHIDYQRLVRLDEPVFRRNLDDLEEFLENDLEGILLKYYDGTSRRILQTEQFGTLNHGLWDYLRVVDQGERGVAYLLSHNRVARKDVRVPMGDGYVETLHFSQETRMPFEGREAQGEMAAKRALEVYKNEGESSARDFLLSLGDRTNRTYAKRVDAIVAAMRDFKGQRHQVPHTEVEFTEKAFRVAMKKPADTGLLSGATARTTSRALRGFNAVTLLGWTTLTSIPDTVLPLIASGSFRTWSKGLSKYMADPDYRQALQNIGVSIDSQLHSRLTGMLQHDEGSKIAKGVNAFFNVTMLTPWTNTMREIAGSVGYEMFKAEINRGVRLRVGDGTNLAQQPAEYKRIVRRLNHYGLGDYIRGNRTIDNLSALEDPAVRVAILKFTNETIFAPNPNDIPLWAQTPVGSIIFQLKSFPLMMSRFAGRIIREAKNGNVKPAAYFLTLGPAAGAAAMSIKDVVQSRGGETGHESEVRNRNLAKFMGYDEKVHGNKDDFLGWYLEALLAMGGLGLLADVFHNVSTQVDNGAYGTQRILSTLLGPSIGSVQSAVNVIGGAKDAATGATGSNAKERQAIREIASRVPIAGGHQALREGAVDALAGEATKRSSGGSDDGFGTGF